MGFLLLLPRNEKCKRINCGHSICHNYFPLSASRNLGGLWIGSYLMVYSVWELKYVSLRVCEAYYLLACLCLLVFLLLCSLKICACIKMFCFCCWLAKMKFCKRSSKTWNVAWREMHVLWHGVWSCWCYQIQGKIPSKIRIKWIYAGLNCRMRV